MIKIIFWDQITNNEQIKILQRPQQVNTKNLQQTVFNIIQQVQLKGDIALTEFTQQFDSIAIQSFKVTQKELNAAYRSMSPRTLTAMKNVIANIFEFHKHQLRSNIKVETLPGIHCELRSVPLARIGFYIPAGNAPLVSTVFMLGIPAKIAANPMKILCSPANRDGQIDPHILVAAQLCEIENIYKLGGAQAIAAMAYGTESIPKVDKIFGPGNQFVTEAKLQVSQDASGARIDLPAGPSEVMIIADQYAQADYVAADLLSQAEHGTDSQVIVIATSHKLAQQINQSIVNLISKISRAHIAQCSLAHSSIIIANNIDDAIAIANRYAPEHLILQVKEPRKYLNHITSAGSVFLGSWSPEAAGDYASGTNHVLPTYGYAHTLSGLSVADFVKQISIQELTREGLAAIAETIGVMTKIEGLDAHQLAIDIRLREMNVCKK